MRACSGDGNQHQRKGIRPVFNSRDGYSGTVSRLSTFAHYKFGEKSKLIQVVRGAGRARLQPYDYR